MTPREYLTILKRHALTQSWAGATFSKTTTSGRRWGLGDHPIPKPVAIVLRLIDRGKITPKDVADAAQDKPET